MLSLASISLWRTSEILINFWETNCIIDMPLMRLKYELNTVRKGLHYHISLLPLSLIKSCPSWVGRSYTLEGYHWRSVDEIYIGRDSDVDWTKGWHWICWMQDFVWSGSDKDPWVEGRCSISQSGRFLICQSWMFDELQFCQDYTRWLWNSVVHAPNESF